MDRNYAQRGGNDLIQERERLEKSNPGLVRSYAAFLVSFSKYRRVERNQTQRSGIKESVAARR